MDYISMVPPEAQLHGWVGGEDPHPAFPASAIQPQRFRDSVPELQVMEGRPGWESQRIGLQTHPSNLSPALPEPCAGALKASLAFQFEVLQFKKGAGGRRKI